MTRIAILIIAAVLAGCAGGPILANPPAQRPVATNPPKPSPIVRADPQPVEFPRDDAPHDRLTEWWYYTGHLSDANGSEWGFEYVVFRAERGRFPVSWASHLAITDETGQRFTYAQRSEIGPQVDHSPEDGFDFSLAGGAAAPWLMSGRSGVHRLTARADGPETAGDEGAIALNVELRDAAEPVPHDGDGWIDFGPAGGSYYYSRMRMDAAGRIQIDGAAIEVTGTGWFDHQWGDFIAVGGGGWDWFAVNLDDGTDLTLSLVRDRDGTYPLVYGTLVDPDGTVRHLPRDAFSVLVTSRWQSPATGADYPAGWRIALPGEELVINLSPTVAAQELDTRPTTGVVYWEGSQLVRATRAGQPLGGKAYVELTGYGPRHNALYSTRAWQRLSARVLRAWRGQHGNWCPGYHVTLTRRAT